MAIESSDFYFCCLFCATMFRAACFLEPEDSRDYIYTIEFPCPSCGHLVTKDIPGDNLPVLEPSAN